MQKNKMIYLVLTHKNKNKKIIVVKNGYSQTS